MNENEVIAELKEKEADHSKWRDWDFNKAQIVLWSGILASVTASMQAAGALSRPAWLDPIWARFLAAAIAGVPALAILIDKTFKWSARSAWHALYTIRVRALIRGARDRQESSSEISKSLDALELEMHNTFPTLDGSVLAPKQRP